MIETCLESITVLNSFIMFIFMMGGTKQFLTSVMNMKCKFVILTIELCVRFSPF